MYPKYTICPCQASLIFFFCYIPFLQCPLFSSLKLLHKPGAWPMWKYCIGQQKYRSCTKWTIAAKHATIAVPFLLTALAWTWRTIGKKEGSKGMRSKWRPKKVETKYQVWFWKSSLLRLPLATALLGGWRGVGGSVYIILLFASLQTACWNRFFPLTPPGSHFEIHVPIIILASSFRFLSWQHFLS